MDIADGDTTYFYLFPGKKLFVKRLMGKIHLIKGNHDKEKLSVYSKYFDDIRGTHQVGGMILSHIPIHPESLGRWNWNVHGHLHCNRVKLDGVPDPRYKCVCMEQINYTPVSLEELGRMT